jgi:hypothetical protein
MAAALAWPRDRFAACTNCAHAEGAAGLRGRCGFTRLTVSEHVCRAAIACPAKRFTSTEGPDAVPELDDGAVVGFRPMTVRDVHLRMLERLAGAPAREPEREIQRGGARRPCGCRRRSAWEG